MLNTGTNIFLLRGSRPKAAGVKKKENQEEPVTICDRKEHL